MVLERCTNAAASPFGVTGALQNPKEQSIITLLPKKDKDALLIIGDQFHCLMLTAKLSLKPLQIK